MNAATSELLPVDEYARQHNLPPEHVINMIKDGLKPGRLIDNRWFISMTEEAREGRRDDEPYPPTNAVTAHLQAAAILDNGHLYALLHEREHSPLRAETPELGVDMSLVKKTADDWNTFNFSRDLLVTCIAAVTGVWLAGIAGDEYRYEFDAGMIASDIGMILLALAGITAITFGYSVWCKREARRALNPDRILEHATPAECMPRNNLVVYGGFIPFVGSGIEVNSWSFTVDLTAPLYPDNPVADVSCTDLYSDTIAALQKLGIQDLQLGDQVFVDGKDASHLPIVQPEGAFSRPRKRLGVEDIELFIGKNHARIRHYKMVRAYLWSGQLVLSSYFRYVIRSGILYTEAKIYMLLPLNEKYTEACNPDHFLRLRHLGKDLLTRMLLSPFSWIPSAFRVYAAIMSGLASLFASPVRKNIREIKNSVRYNYGWISSLRELLSTTNYERYFQKMDKDFHVKMINEALLESLRGSLEKHNIATDFLKQASTTIFNEGIIVSGGKVSAENIAAGRGAKSVTTKVGRKQRQPQA